MNTPAITLKIKSIFDWIASNVSTQKLYGLWMTDLVMGGSLLKILNGAPIISINKIIRLRERNIFFKFKYMKQYLTKIIPNKFDNKWLKSL